MRISTADMGYIFGAAILLALTIFAAYKVSQPHGLCAGAPYLYLTFHDEQTNVLKYSRNGCLLSSEVLLGGPQKNKNHRTELRGISHGTYKNSPVMYVADGNSKHSYLMVYGQCDKNGQRPYIEEVASSAKNPGADHMYGVAQDSHGNVYVTSQHTDNVLRFTNGTFEPMPFPSMMATDSSQYRPNYPGTFVQFGLPMEHEITEQGVRDIISVGTDMWIANEDLSGIAIVDAFSGELSTIVPIANPIGLFYQEETELVFVSSKLKHKNARIYAISTKTYQVVKQFRKKHMKHPAGLVAHGDFLYVADQVIGDIAKYSISKGKYLGLAVRNVPGTVEAITLSDC